MKPSYDDGFCKMIVGDACDVLPQLPEKSVHCCVTSPPYFGLRSYLPAEHPEKANEGGTQETPDEYVAWLVEVMRGVWRVLRDDGTLWLNLGDSYAANRSYQVRDSKHLAHDFNGSNAMRVPIGLKPKDLLMIPARVALALQADGWYLRSQIVWAKPNPMPESVTDRPTQATEMVYLFSKKPRYFYDSDAVREPHIKPFDNSNRSSYVGSASGYRLDDGLRPAKGDAGLPLHPAGRNLRNYWHFSTRPYPGSHYATFPPELPERCIKAGTSERGVCSECGAPYVRVVERTPLREVLVRNKGGKPPKHSGRRALGLRSEKSGLHGSNNHGDMPTSPESRTMGFNPTCSHDAEISPAIVLDPFSGSGTTGLVARRLGRKSILIDLDERNVRLLEERLVQGVLC